VRTTILRRLEILEREGRADEKTKQAFLTCARSTLCEIVLGYYLGEMQTDARDEREAFIRTLNYTYEEYYDAVMGRPGGPDRDIEAVRKRWLQAYRRLFAKVGLDFDTAPSQMLFKGFVKMVDQLPAYWSQRIRYELSQGDMLLLMRVPRFYARFAPGSNVPFGITAENYLCFL
jgi:hypothetical protein